MLSWTTCLRSVKLLLQERGCLRIVGLVGSIQHVEEVLAVAEALIGRGGVAAAGPVVGQGRNGRNLACAQQPAHDEINLVGHSHQRAMRLGLQITGACLWKAISTHGFKSIGESSTATRA